MRRDLSVNVSRDAVVGSHGLAGELGFEPRQTESESVVLPLHHSPRIISASTISYQIMLHNYLRREFRSHHAWRRSTRSVPALASTRRGASCVILADRRGHLRRGLTSIGAGVCLSEGPHSRFGSPSALSACCPKQTFFALSSPLRLRIVVTTYQASQCKHPIHNVVQAEPIQKPIIARR